MKITEQNIEFTKMHGAGNDYVYIDCVQGECPLNLPELAVRIADRHFGIGGDGLVVLLPSEVADFRMRMFNADGSEAQMCGNASRCIAKLVYDKGYAKYSPITLETLSGIKTLYYHPDEEGQVESVTVDMGYPYLDPDSIPVRESESFPPVIRLDEKYKAIAVGMGNPHGVIFTDDLSDANVLGNGPKFETNKLWPQKANIEFAKVINPHKVEMRVWERGTGETLACGTGACATAVAGILSGRLKSPVEVCLRGGTLTINWPDTDSTIKMTGPAITVAVGKFYYRSP